MDIATIVGLFGGLVIVGSAIVLGGDPVIFVNIPSILIVICGSLFVVSMKFSVSQLKTAFTVALKAFLFKIENTDEIIVEILKLATIGRKQGPLALENVEVKNTFLKRGVQLYVDATDENVAQSILEREKDATYTRHEDGRKIFMAINDVAPAMGMIGTLIGLVKMLANMSSPDDIGPAMAVALLTTLYGAIIANMVAKPIADKLSLRSEEEDIIQSMIVDSVLGMIRGHSPTNIEENLMSYLPKKTRTEVQKMKEAEEKATAA